MSEEVLKQSIFLWFYLEPSELLDWNEVPANKANGPCKRVAFRSVQTQLFQAVMCVPWHPLGRTCKYSRQRDRKRTTWPRNNQRTGEIQYFSRNRDMIKWHPSREPLGHNVYEDCSLEKKKTIRVVQLWLYFWYNLDYSWLPSEHGLAPRMMLRPYISRQFQSTYIM